MTSYPLSVLSPIISCYPGQGTNRKQKPLPLANPAHVTGTEHCDWSVYLSCVRAVVYIIGGRDRKQLTVRDCSISCRNRERERERGRKVRHAEIERELYLPMWSACSVHNGTTVVQRNLYVGRQETICIHPHSSGLLEE